MDCVVNQKYRYIMFYGAKAACTSLRTLFLAIHGDELSEQQHALLDSYHNLNDVCPYDSEQDYSKYYKFYLSRNPFSRVVSAYLDQYTFARHKGVQRMLTLCPPKNGEPQTLLELLRYLRDVPDYLRDSHFQTQTHFGYAVMLNRKPWLRRLPENHIALDYYGDIGQFANHLERVFKKIFRRDKQKRDFAIAEINNVPRMNNLIYGRETWPNAAEIHGDELRAMPFAPKPQDFFTSPEVCDLVAEIYARDFEMFGYDVRDIPNKKPSKELNAIPLDFDWQTYALLNPDLAPQGVTNERRLTHHYLMHGRHEEKKRFYKMEPPSGFDWQTYVGLHADLQAAGIDNPRDALIHYLAFGYHEQRPYQEPESL